MSGDFLARQFEQPGIALMVVQLFIVLILATLPIALWRADRRRARETKTREALALAEIADYVCDLIIAISDAFIDEVNAQEFVEAFERRQLEDGQMMLEAIVPQSLPSMILLRPLFELRTIIEDGIKLVNRLTQIMDDPERDGWQDARVKARRLAERAALAADSFRSLAEQAESGRI